MHEILRALAPGSRVLDLGCNRGSFDETAYSLKVVRADLEAHTGPNFVQCSAAALPFADRSFHAVVSNHSFEHFENLDACVRELARILAPGAFIYIAVPDSSTFTDRVYRWLGRGGGHVNAFNDVDMLPRRITAATGVPLTQIRVLCSSLSFLNRRNLDLKPQRKLLLFANGRESVLRILVFALRTLDRRFGFRAGVYGWAYFLGNLDDVDAGVQSNVCIKCGSAHSSAFLESFGRVNRRRFFPSTFACPSCSTRNFYTDDRHFQNLK